LTPVDVSSISTIYDVTLFLHKLALSEITSNKKKGMVNKYELAERWFIGIDTAQKTIQATTQRGVRHFLGSKGTRRMKHTAHQLLYRNLRAVVYSDTMFSGAVLLRQNTCAQVHSTEFHWVKVYPMRRKADAHLTLSTLSHDVGVFHTMVTDNAPELAKGKFKKKATHAGAVMHPIEAHTHNQNLAESSIRELRRMYKRAMRETNAPHVLWDYCRFAFLHCVGYTNP
jgi:hypothetical protein